MSSGKIQPAPPGLLSKLALKQNGPNPTDLSDQVVPIIDLTNWYSADASVPVVGIDLTLGSGVLFQTILGFSSQPLVVPDNEIWWVRGFEVELAGNGLITVVDIYELFPVLLYREVASGLRGRITGESRPFNGTGIPPGDAQLFTSPSIRDLWAPPGSEFAFGLYGSFIFAGAFVTVRGMAMVDKFRI